MLKDKERVIRTQETYSTLWKNGSCSILERWHFNDMQEKVTEPIVRGRVGIDIGSGRGNDVFIMAKDNPQVTILGLDISDGIFRAKEIVAGFDNIKLIKGSVLELPLKSSSLDFAYSYGVLHHTPNPLIGLKQICRVLKAGAPVFLYLYEDHQENLIKNSALKLIKGLRIITVKLPRKLLLMISFIMSPFVVILFSLPARILNKFVLTKPLANKIPFNFGTHLFSVAGDLYDRFGAPLEFRYSRKQVAELLSDSGFNNIKIEKLDSKAGWVAWGYKSNA